MEYKWRSWSRVIAYIDLVFSGLTLLVIGGVIIGAAIVAVVGTKSVVNPQSDEALSKTSVLGLAGLVLIFLAAVPAFQVWGALKLLQATNANESPSIALKKAQIWMNINVVILIITIIYKFLQRRWMDLIISNVFRAGLIYIVYNFMTELQSAT